MATDRVDQATDDVFAYIESLDAREALGELLHVSRQYEQMAGATLALGKEPTTLAMMMMPVCIALGLRIADGDGGMVPIPPPHDGSIHSCQLIARSVQAARG